MSRPSDIPNLPPLTPGQKQHLHKRATRLASRNPAAIVELARKHSSRAVAILAEIMEDKEAPPAVRVKAAEVIIERGYGKAPLAVTIDEKNSSDNGGVSGRILSIAERILMLKMAQEQRGETLDLEMSQAQPVHELQPAEDLVG